jgi:hypothetical protein
LEAERNAARAVFKWRTQLQDGAKAQFRIATEEDVWMSFGWMKNSYPDSAASMIRELEAAETARRAKELQEQQNRAAPTPAIQLLPPGLPAKIEKISLHAAGCRIRMAFSWAWGCRAWDFGRSFQETASPSAGSTPRT